MPTEEMLLYARQAQLGLAIPTHVAVIGLGGIGSWVAIQLAMSGVPNLTLFDPDNVEESNRNRLPFCQGSIGRPKVEVVSEFIRAIRPDCTIVGIPEKLEGVLVDVILTSHKLVIECTDSPKSQLRLFKRATELGIRFIRAGYDGTRITITSNVSGWIKDSEEETYTVNPSWVVPAITVAAMAVAKALKYPQQEVNLDISEIGVPILRRQKRLTKRCTE